jgi:D-amino-acid dehydrogenase
MAADSKHVLVVGGGIIGLCVAYYAARRGHRVTVVERGGPDHNGCSLGNAGMIVPSHFVPLAAPGMVRLGLRMLLNPEGPFAIRPRASADLMHWGWRFVRAANAAHVERSAPLLRDLNLRSRCLFKELADEWGSDFGLTRRGLLMLCKTERTLREETHVAGSARRLGLPAEVLTPEEAARLEPGVQMDIAGAVYFPQDCHLDPARFVAELTRALTKHGATFCWSTDVTDWRTDGKRVHAVQTSRGELTADEFVLAGGAWSGRAARDLGLFLPLQAGKGYSVTLPTAPQRPSICAILTEARVAVTPMDGALLRFAGTMEIGGLDTAINRRRVKGMLKSIPRYFPEFQPDDFAALPVWAGLRPCSPDGLPYIGRPRRYANLVIATGHAMMGVSLAPITGKLVAEIVSDQSPSIETELLRPDRYARTPS